jgi:hypothetical protein
MLVVFALMQCIAPIAHAHTDGHSIGHGAHIDLDTSRVSDPVSAPVSSLSATHSHSSVISMPPEHSSEKPPFPIHSQRETTLILADMALTQVAIVRTAPLIYKHYTYDLPFGQAPPL